MFTWVFVFINVLIQTCKMQERENWSALEKTTVICWKVLQTQKRKQVCRKDLTDRRRGVSVTKTLNAFCCLQLVQAEKLKKKCWLKPGLPTLTLMCQALTLPCSFDWALITAEFVCSLSALIHCFDVMLVFLYLHYHWTLKTLSCCDSRKQTGDWHPWIWHFIPLKSCQTRVCVAFLNLWGQSKC